MENVKRICMPSLHLHSTNVKIWPCRRIAALQLCCLDIYQPWKIGQSQDPNSLQSMWATEKYCSSTIRGSLSLSLYIYIFIIYIYIGNSFAWQNCTLGPWLVPHCSCLLQALLPRAAPGVFNGFLIRERVMFRRHRSSTRVFQYIRVKFE